MGYIPAMIFNKPDFGGPLSVRVETLENNEQIYQVFEYLGQSTSGTITIPTEATIFDFHNDGLLDAIMVEADANENPTDRNATNSLGEIVQVTSLNNAGDYVLDSIPIVNSCIVYFIKIKAVYAQNVPLSSIVEAGIPLIQTSYGVITAAKSNADFTSLKAAVDYANTQASLFKPFVIKASGFFTEDPMTVNTGVQIMGENCLVSPTDQNNPLFTLNENTELWGVRMLGPANSYGVYSNTPNSAFKNGAVLSTGLHGFYIGPLSNLLIRDTTVTSQSGSAFYADGGTPTILNAAGVNCDMIIYSENGAKVEMSSISSKGTVTWDVYQSDAASNITVTNCNFSEDRLFFTDAANCQMGINSDKEDDKAFINIQEIRCGIPEQGFEAVFGEGDSYTRGMMVYTEDILNAFVDVSTAARSASGSTFTFPGLVAGNAIYMASDLQDSSGSKLAFYGFKTLLSTAATLGTGNFIIQYYNAINGWTDSAYMETQSGRRYYQYARNVFTHTGSHHIRGPVQLIVEDDPNLTWNLSDPISSGTGRYWIRILIENDIDVLPVFEQFKLHTSRFEVNTDGWIEYFGAARPKGRLSLSPGRELSGSMINKNIWIDNNLGAGLVNNQISTTTQYNGALGPIPDDLDTSSVARLTIYLRSDAAQSITLDCDYGAVTSGDIAYITNPALIPISSRKSVVVSHTFTAAGEVGVLEFDLDFSDFRARKDPADGVITSDLVALTVNAIVLPSNIQIISESVDYFKWSEGGHI